MIHSSIDIDSGTGFGTQNNILTIQKTGGAGIITDTEEGMVAWNGINADVLTGGEVVSGVGKTRTYTFAELNITDASQILFEWNPAEVGTGQLTEVYALKMSIYKNDGDGTADYEDSLLAPVTHPATINNGVGGNGFDYLLDSAGVLSLNTWL
ncbi:MAG: hypothetical protein KJ630_11730 [Proteobacteria bacterium]|nr:hypothetical protein [Pseudomonadota bacterium]